MVSGCALVSIAYPSLDIICLAMVGNLIFTSLGRSVFESQMVIAMGAVILSVSHIYFSITTSMGFFRYEPLAVLVLEVWAGHEHGPALLRGNKGSHQVGPADRHINVKKPIDGANAPSIFLFIAKRSICGIP